jgi:hypothetical protein
VVRRRSAHVAIAAFLTVAGVVAACSVATSSGSPGAAAPGASATPTLNPNQLAEQRRSSGASTAPAGSQPPAASFPGLPTPSAYAPDLEAMLPAAVVDVPLTRFSAPASLYDVGGDICSLLCPGEPSRLAKAAGVPVTALTVAVAFPAQGANLRAAVIAIRFDGLDPKASPVDVRVKAGGHVSRPNTDGLVAKTTPMEAGSRTVTWVTWPPFYRPEEGEYLLSSGNVLFIVAGLPPTKDDKVPDDIRRLVEALP